jgi:hypothetical protein
VKLLPALPALLLALALPAVAAAAPRPLSDADHARLAGDAVVFSNANGRRVTVSRVAFSGSAPTTILRYKAPEKRLADAVIDASPERAGAVITLTNERGFLKSAQAFLGAPAGRLKATGKPVAITEFSPSPAAFHMAGTTAILERDDGSRTAIEEDGTEVSVELPETISAVDFSGDLVAYGARVGTETEEDPPTELVVANWRTGDTIRSEELEAGILSLDLREDGAVALQLDGAGIQLALPGEAVRRLTQASPRPTWAGDRLVTVRDRFQRWQELGVVELDGSRSALGVPSATITDVTADADRVVWVANGCALTAPVTDGAATVPAAGPCPRTEAIVTTVSARLRNNRLRPRVRCLAAAAECEGTITSSKTRPASFAIAPGETQPVALRLKPDTTLDTAGTLRLRVSVAGGRPLRHLISVVS